MTGSMPLSYSLSCAIPCATLVLALGCTDGTVVGPEAQAAFEQGIELAEKSPQTSRPLVLVNGEIREEVEVRDIDPETIERIEVWKGTAAVAKYGEDAAHGVILITTKHASGR